MRALVSGRAWFAFVTLFAIIVADKHLNLAQLGDRLFRLVSPRAHGDPPFSQS